MGIALRHIQTRSRIEENKQTKQSDVNNEEMQVFWLYHPSLSRNEHSDDAHGERAFDGSRVGDSVVDVCAVVSVAAGDHSANTNQVSETVTARLCTSSLRTSTMSLAHSLLLLVSVPSCIICQPQMMLAL